MRGKKLAPSTHGSSVAAVDHANSSAASRGLPPANPRVAACAPSAVTASCPGGQRESRLMPRTRRCTAANSATAATGASTASLTTC